ncbi:MAG: phosphoribosyl transferase [Dehalococcoidia bacterium]|nr:phosphoribosyl transferase [Dehalococcoidia bacterium]
MMNERKHQPTTTPIFESRYDAGRQLAAKLVGYKNESSVVLAIPNGGVPVAVPVALELATYLDLVIARKLPIPLLPEGGFGAVADDGNAILNDEVLKKFPLTEHQINFQINKVRSDIRQRSLLYRGTRPLPGIAGKTAIIIDDGLASGYTMMAAVASVRRRDPQSVVVAVPVASATALGEVEKLGVRVVTVSTAHVSKFYVADYYRYWDVLTDEQGVKCFKDWQARRSQNPAGGELPARISPRASKMSH